MLLIIKSPHFIVRGFLFCLLCSFYCTSFAQQKYLLSVGEKSITISKDNNNIIIIDSISFNHIAQSSQQLLYSSDDSMVIQLQYNNIPEFNMINGSLDHTENLVITKNGGAFHFHVAPRWADYFTIHMADNNDHFFGLTEGLHPDNNKSPDLRGKIIDVEINGEMYGIQENFASAWSSFYYNPKGYASFVNSFARGRYQLAVNGKSTIHHATGKLDWYIFTGDHRQIYNQYYQVIGSPKSVPLWACGPTVWRDENRNGSAEVLDDAAQFAALKIPLTCLMIDRPYSNGAQLWSKMDFSKKFADPGKWIAELNTKYGLKLLTWIAPATFSDKEFPGLLQGSFGYIDLSNPASVTAFGKRLKTEQYTFGVRGHKMDRADEDFPGNENWYDRTPEEERKNKYAYLYAKVTDSLLKDSWGSDQLNYARAAIHGSQPYLSGIWGGDSRTGWDGMAANMANAVRAAYMGFPNWGTDVGGYLGPTGKIPDDLYIRWLQWGVFNGIYEIKVDGAGGGGEDRVPWHCSVGVQDAFRKACELRMEWLPHIYSQLNSSAVSGPLMKPLGMVYPSDSSVYDIWDQYIFGNSIMVAPLFSGETKRNVYLPEGEWIDYHTHERISGKRIIVADAPMTHIPMYIKSNSFQLRGNIYSGNQQAWNKNTGNQYMDIYFYPGTGIESFHCVDANQNNKIIPFTGTATAKNIMLDIPSISYPGKIKVFTPSKPAAIKINGRKVKIIYENNFVICKRVLKNDMNVDIKL